MSAPVALVAGSGGVLGEALMVEFRNAGYQVAGLRRNLPRQARADDIRVLACDLTDPRLTEATARQVVDELGPVDVLVCNAAHLQIAPFLDLGIEDFEACWRATVGSAIGCARAVLPSMRRRERGAMIFSGATASARAAANFAAFASAKFALRALAQSLAREYQPQGLHVCHVVLDGLLLGSPSMARFGRTDDRALAPADVARTYRWLAEQPASTWTQELDLRPRGESF
jgi:NAD(P)-dependent dehydrogenase (short-subunit alcohol dehydrogenase family)